MDDLVVGVGKPQGLKKLLLQAGLELEWSSCAQSREVTSPKFLSKQRSSLTSQHLVQASPRRLELPVPGLWECLPPSPLKSDPHL